MRTSKVKKGGRATREGRVAVARRGRPSLYSPELAELICHRLADGESLRAICASDDMPSRESVRRWLRDDADFVARYARARADQADALWDEAVDKAREATDSASAQCARVFLEATSKLAAKLAPKVYGDKLTAEVTGKDGGPIEELITNLPELGRHVAFLLARGLHAQEEEERR
jgi:hypothetical protein